MLRFNDGVEIDTDGAPRILRLFDGLYVVGAGYSIPVRDEIEARTELDRLRERIERPFAIRTQKEN